MAREVKYRHARPQRDYVFRTSLAIDWGSEAVRTKLFYKLDGREPLDRLVQFTPRPADLATDRGEMKRQFTSDIYPFDIEEPNPPGKMIYPGNALVLGRKRISSKLAMYALVGISDKVASQSPQLKKLRELAEKDPQIKQNIRIGIQQMLLDVLRTISEALGPRRPDAVALTIPAQWTVEFEEEYGDIINVAWEQVFAVAAPQIIFLSEGQTNVHYAFFRGTFDARDERQHLSAQGLFEIGRTKNAVLVIDAGGHSTNTSLVTICDDDNQLEIRPDDGAIGGTAMWAWYVLEQATIAWKQQFNTKLLPVEVENEILSIFYALSFRYTSTSGASFTIKGCGPNGMDFHFSLSPEKLVQAFNAAFAHAFALIEEGLGQLMDLRPNCDRIEVLIGGGSAKGVMWVNRMNNLCRSYQMGDPIYLFRVDSNLEHARLAAGANYALANAKSVPQFVGRAAFGLAVKKWYYVDGIWTHEWDCQNALLWAQGQKWTRTVKTNGTQEFKVICQPEFDDPQAGSVIETDYRAYDLLPIPCRKTGALKFDFEIDLVNDRLKLTVKKKLGRAKRFSELGTVIFDLWVPPGSRCLQLWDCEEDIDARVTAAFSPGQQPAGDDAVNGAAWLPGGQLGALPSPPAEDEDVQMAGMEDDQAIADSTDVVMEDSQPGPSRRGNTVPTGIMAPSGGGPSSRRM